MKDAVVIAWTHDQGLIPFKLLHGGDGVQLTLGLPFIRTSPVHGTAYDIAGQGIADPGQHAGRHPPGRVAAALAARSASGRFFFALRSDLFLDLLDLFLDPLQFFRVFFPDFGAQLVLFRLELFQFRRQLFALPRCSLQQGHFFLPLQVSSALSPWTAAFS